MQIRECFLELASGQRIFVTSHEGQLDLRIMQPRSQVDNETDEALARELLKKARAHNPGISTEQETKILENRLYIVPLCDRDSPYNAGALDKQFDTLAAAGIELTPAMRQSIHALTKNESEPEPQQKETKSKSSLKNSLKSDELVKPAGFANKIAAPDPTHAPTKGRKRPDINISFSKEDLEDPAKHRGTRSR